MTRAVDAWRRAAPRGDGPAALLRHGLRVAEILALDAEDGATRRALGVAAVLHEIGLFVHDRGHFVVRGARWAAIHMDDLLPGAGVDERRLVGELILFHRHRGRLPTGVASPHLVERFRRVELWDRAAGPPPPGPAASLEAAVARHPRGPLDRTLRRALRREFLRHPVLTRRITRIRRPDR